MPPNLTDFNITPKGIDVKELTSEGPHTPHYRTVAQPLPTEFSDPDWKNPFYHQHVLRNKPIVQKFSLLSGITSLRKFRCISMGMKTEMSQIETWSVILTSYISTQHTKIWSMIFVLIFLMVKLSGKSGSQLYDACWSAFVWDVQGVHV